MFKFGDKVTCLIFGKGEVQEVWDEENNIGVRFQYGRCIYYTLDGKYNRRANRILFHGHHEYKDLVNIPTPPIPDKGEYVYVKCTNDALWVLSISTGETADNGYLICEANGLRARYKHWQVEKPTY